MLENEIAKKCPEVHSILIQFPNQPDWSEVFTSLEKLNWLTPPDSIDHLLHNTFKLIDDLTPDKLSTVQLDPVLFFLNSVIFSVSINKNLNKKYIDEFIQLCSDLTFFKNDQNTNVFKIEPKFAIMKKLLHIIFMHLENPFIAATKKNIQVYLSDLFYNYFISGNIEELSHSHQGVEILKRYPKPRYFYVPYFSRLPPNVNNYFGEYESGKKHGHGLSSLLNGDFYKGEFRDGLMHGTGTYYWANGGYYEGSFNQGNIDGKGTEHLQTGNVYTGNFVNGKKHGFGEMKFINGDRYIGSWKFNCMEGEGEFCWNSGVVFKGWFSKDKRNGKGEITMENGIKFNDEWHNDENSLA